MSELDIYGPAGQPGRRDQRQLRQDAARGNLARNRAVTAENITSEVAYLRAVNGEQIARQVVAGMGSLARLADTESRGDLGLRASMAVVVDTYGGAGAYLVHRHMTRP